MWKIGSVTCARLLALLTGFFTAMWLSTAERRVGYDPTDLLYEKVINFAITANWYAGCFRSPTTCLPLLSSSLKNFTSRLFRHFVEGRAMSYVFEGYRY